MTSEEINNSVQQMIDEMQKYNFEGTEEEIIIKKILFFDKYVKENIDYGFEAMNFLMEHPGENNPYGSAFEVEGFFKQNQVNGKRLAVCGSISKVANLFFNTQGIECNYVWGHFNCGTEDKPKYAGHRWNVITIGDKKCMVDFTIGMIVHNLMKDSNYARCSYELFGITDESKEFDYLFFDKLAPNESIGGFKKDEHGRTVDDLDEIGRLKNITTNPYDIYPDLSFIPPQLLSQYNELLDEKNNSYH